MTNKFHWKHYCNSCRSFFVGNSLEINCVFCESTDLQSDFIPVKEVTGLLQTEDFQEFCDKLQLLLVGEND